MGYTLLIPNGENDRKMAPQLLDLLSKLRMINNEQLEQMVNGEFEQKKKYKHKESKMNIKKTSLMSTFVKASNGGLNVKKCEQPSDEQTSFASIYMETRRSPNVLA